MTGLVYTSDLHGDLTLYRAAGEAALHRDASILIFGGDLCPGMPSASATYLPKAQPQFLLSEVSPLIREWKRQQPRLEVFAIPGNDDCATIVPALAELEKEGLLTNVHARHVSVRTYSLVGLAFVPPTPFSFKDFERRDTLAGRPREPQLGRMVFTTPDGFQRIDDFDGYLKSLATIEEELSRLAPEDSQRTIAVTHSPPYGTNCDVLFNGEHIGSVAIRRWIERHQPLLTLHGHIHESPQQSGVFFDQIGKTLVVNPGASGRRPHWVHVDLESLTEIEHAVYGKKRIHPAT